jgi:hypothetical protein
MHGKGENGEFMKLVRIHDTFMLQNIEQDGEENA